MGCPYKLRDECDKAGITPSGETLSYSACSVCVQLEILKEIKMLRDEL